MGVDMQSLQLLLVARRMGVEFDRTITLGRQDLLLAPDQLLKACNSFGLTMDDGEARHIAFDANRFCDLLFKKIGAATVDSLDASGFEGATVIHDLNEPLPSRLNGQFSLVFDGGTLEHVFDFPKAIRGCMELPALGGHFIMASPANNQMGHGFYQFGPDLFYRIFSPENGYKLKALFLAPAFADGNWFKVRDPASVGARVGHNRTPDQLSLFAIAQRTSVVPIFSRAPQQQDYAAGWKARSNELIDPSRLKWFDEAVAATDRDRRALIKRALRALIPQGIRRWLQAWRVGLRAGKPPDPAHFEPFPLPPL
jgi:hypothetical protein